jgi:hypothetical protein
VFSDNGQQYLDRYGNGPTDPTGSALMKSFLPTEQAVLRIVVFAHQTMQKEKGTFSTILRCRLPFPNRHRGAASSQGAMKVPGLAKKPYPERFIEKELQSWE